MPGTVASLATTIILAGLYCWPGPAWWTAVLLIGLIGSSALSVVLGPWANEHFGKKDPREFVLDEVAGICVSNLFLPMLGWPRQGWILAGAFVAFRVFDVTK